MGGLLAALLAAYGVYLIYTHVAFGWTGLAPSPRPSAARHRSTIAALVERHGVVGVRARDLLLACGALFFVGALVGYLLFGGALPAIAIATFAASFPVAWQGQRVVARRAVAQEAWPRMIDEVRVLTGSVGRSIPQALFDVGQRAPKELRTAFDAAHREWLVSTDFERTLSVLKHGLADPTADAACETLLIAHELGGGDVDRRLEDLADDRRADLHYRKDARARQAGVRFARRFVLLVPLGMALAGMTVGTGRAAYATPTGQVAVAIAIGMVVLCWLWAGHIMRLPEEERVFRS
jgi:tight adherence protein B